MAILLSVIIPARNEVRRLPSTLERVERYFASLDIEWELLVVDNGSSDGTDRLVEDFAKAHPCVRLVRESRPGKGAAVRTGMLAAQGELALFSDADLSCPIEEERKLREALSAGYDVAIASRRLPGSDAERTAERKLMSLLFNWIVQIIALPGISDSQCGFKGFRREAAGRIFRAGMIDGWAFDVEILFLARHMGCRIAEIPVRWRQVGDSKIRAFGDAARMVRDMLRMRWNWARGVYRDKVEKGP